MKPELNLSTTTQAELFEGLGESEKIRKKILLNYTIIGSVLFIGFLIEAITWMSIAIAFIVLFVLVYTYWYGIPVSRFEKSFLQQITHNTIQLVNPNLQVDFSRHLKASELINLGLIAPNPEYFGGKNILFQDNETSRIRISEIYAKWPPANKYAFPPTQQIFNGFIAIATLNNSFPGTICITTQEAYISATQHANPLLINESFDNGIYLAGDSLHLQNDSKVAIVKSKILDYHQQYQKHVGCIIIRNQIGLIVLNGSEHHYFSPSVFKTVYNKENVNAYYIDLRFLNDTISALS